MQFLDASESSYLHSILANHFLVTHETARSDMLINCGLESLLNTLSTLRGSAALFVNELCAQLSQAKIVAQPSGQPGMVAVLDFLTLPPYDVDISPAEKKFLERVKQQYQRWHAVQIQQLSSIDQPQAREEQNELLQPPIRTPRGINKEQLILNYGFYSLMAEFASHINYETAAAFTIGGDFAVLRGYILERVLRNMSERIPGPQKLLEMSLDAEDIVEGNTVLLKKFLNRYSCTTLSDLIHRFPKRHILLVTWCYAVPSRQMEIEAAKLWKEVEENMVALLRAQHQCFVLILANVEAEGKPYQIENFTPLYVPSKFEMPDLLPWVRGRLEHLEIKQDDIELCLNRLRDQRGDITRTYHELEYIVRYLREKYG